MSVWAALGFMVLGGLIVELAELKAWNRYKQGKREGEEYRRKGG
jgi:hypothetical protein